MPIEKVLLTIPEFCEATGLGRTTVKALVARGEVESVRIGRARRISVDAMHDWVDGRRASVD